MSTSKAHKVFCIGFMKTGTTTLNQALTILGYKVSHNSWQWLRDIVRKDWKRIKDKAAAWDALEDNPIPLIYKELDEMYPGSKFILTTRNPEQWFNSVVHHIGDLRSPMHAWLFGKGKCLPKDDKQHTIAVYMKHIEEVKAYFRERPRDLLVIDLSAVNDWKVLCDFLNEPIPSQAFPHANKSNFNRTKYPDAMSKLKYRKKKLLNPIKIWWYTAMNYLPDPNERT